VATLAKQFGNLIRRRRLAASLTQEALAERANLHCTYISLLERGKRVASIEVLRKLARGLKTTMASLMAELDTT
jgi:transcriptional regulator with XRE-family HTH domain